jgi:choline monooxygenase
LPDNEFPTDGLVICPVAQRWLEYAPTYSKLNGSSLQTYMDLLDFAFAEQIEQAETLPARCYTDLAYLALEAKQIFQRTWQLVARLDQLTQAGSYCTAEIAGEPILLVRGADGQLRGFHNVCRHRASLVAQGAGQCERFRCGYHGWTYDLSGKLIGVPDFEGVANFERERMGLRPLAIATWEQFIFARIDAREQRPLAAYLEDIPQQTERIGISRMQFVERRDYVIECNWKVYVDNYVEGYHLPLVHPSLMRELDYQRYRTITKRFYSRQDAPVKTGYDPQRRFILLGLPQPDAQHLPRQSFGQFDFAAGTRAHVDDLRVVFSRACRR